ncbi:MAG: hypothetical protein ACI4BB_10050 [Coprococcus sp.]
MTQKKRYRGRRKTYVDDYRINENGEYEYQGVRYQWNISEAEGRRLLLQLRLMGPLIFIFILLAGCIPSPGVNHWPFLMIAYLVGLVVSLSLWILLWQMCGEKSPMRGYVYDETVEKLPFRILLTAVFTIASILGEVVYVILYGTEGKAFGAVLFIILEIMALICTMYTWKRFQTVKWEKMQ